MDVIYPLAPYSKARDDWELRYSLRSLDQQSWLGQVYIVGYLPRWCKGVIHLPCPNNYQTCKDANLVNKILRACCEPDISEQFVVNSDDQLFLRRVEPGDMLPMLENENRMANYSQRDKYGNNTWFRRVQDTMYWCRQHGYDESIFQSHTPYLVHRRKYPLAMTEAPWGWGNGLTTHVYFNLTGDFINQQEPLTRTARIKHAMLAPALRATLKDATFLNFNDNGLNSHLKNWIEQRFPQPSRWE